MKVILADDHAIVRQGLKALLESRAQVQVVGEAEDGQEAVQLAEKLSPDIIIMDISMPKINGLEATKQILEKCPQVKVLILSMHQEEAYIKEAFEAGALGYILKDAIYEEIQLALASLKQGRTFLGPSISQLVLDEFVLKRSRENKEPDFWDKLTPREREVLHLFAQDKTRQDIAENLFISPKTVDRHRENIRAKLELPDEGAFMELLDRIADKI